jgi:hypothetical protein
MKGMELGGTLVPGFPFNLPNGTGAIGIVSDPAGQPVGLDSRTPLATQKPASKRSFRASRRGGVARVRSLDRPLAVKSTFQYDVADVNRATALSVSARRPSAGAQAGTAIVVATCAMTLEGMT